MLMRTFPGRFRAKRSWPTTEASSGSRHADMPGNNGTRPGNGWPLAEATAVPVPSIVLIDLPQDTHMQAITLVAGVLWAVATWWLGTFRGRT